MSKDWTGNRASTLSALGARNYADHDRQQDDYYATEPKAARLLMEVEDLSPCIWECACGEGHLSKEFEKAGYKVYSSDKVDRGYGYVQDFLKSSAPLPFFDIVTNPPYKYAADFVEHALEISQEGRKIAMFLKLQFLEGKARKKLLEKYPPKRVYVSSSRLRCAMNGDFEKYAKSSAVCYAWYVWEKGYTGDIIVKLIN